MIKTKNWKYSGKYFVSIIFASILLLSIFSILAHNEFASAVSNAQPNSNIKNINSKTEVNDKSVHVKSPPHIPPIILEQFLQSKICKNKCVHPKNP